MLISGIGTKVLRSEKVFEKCPNCDKQNSTTLSVIQKYAYLYWIPMFPTGKEALSNCENCQVTYDGHHFSPKLKEAYSRVKLNVKKPIWTFSGIGLIAVGIVCIVLVSRQNSAKDAKQILKPKVGDIYEFKYSYNSYTLLKVKEVSKDSVFVLTHNYETTQASGIEDLKTPAYYGYTDEGMAISRENLVLFQKTGKILDVIRN